MPTLFGERRKLNPHNTNKDRVAGPPKIIRPPLAPVRGGKKPGGVDLYGYHSRAVGTRRREKRIHSDGRTKARLGADGEWTTGDLYADAALERFPELFYGVAANVHALGAKMERMRRKKARDERRQRKRLARQQREAGLAGDGVQGFLSQDGATWRVVKPDEDTATGAAEVGKGAPQSDRDRWASGMLSTKRRRRWFRQMIGVGLNYRPEQHRKIMHRRWTRETKHQKKRAAATAAAASAAAATGSDDESSEDGGDDDLKPRCPHGKSSKYCPKCEKLRAAAAFEQQLRVQSEKASVTTLAMSLPPVRGTGRRTKRTKKKKGAGSGPRRSMDSRGSLRWGTPLGGSRGVSGRPLGSPFSSRGTTGGGIVRHGRVRLLSSRAQSKRRKVRLGTLVRPRKRRPRSRSRDRRKRGALVAAHNSHDGLRNQQQMRWVRNDGRGAGSLMAVTSVPFFVGKA